MFVQTKNERERRQYMRTVQQMVSKTFVLDTGVCLQTAQWQAWLDQRPRDHTDLFEYVRTANVRDVSKARAIAILLAPHISWAPFAWRALPCVQSYLFATEALTLRELSPRLLDFAIQLIAYNIDVALAPSADSRMRASLSTYNRYILDALAVLSEDDPRAYRLIDRYQLNDPIPVSEVGFRSGYHPFHDLLGAPSVPEKWKVIVDERMRVVIRAEHTGSRQPREPWEAALPCYVQHIDDWCYCEQFPYSSELFASQVAFLADLPNQDTRVYIDSLYVGELVRLFDSAARTVCSE